MVQCRASTLVNRCSFFNTAGSYQFITPKMLLYGSFNEAESMEGLLCPAVAASIATATDNKLTIQCFLWLL